MRIREPDSNAPPAGGTTVHGPPRKGHRRVRTHLHRGVHPGAYPGVYPGARPGSTPQNTDFPLVTATTRGREGSPDSAWTHAWEIGTAAVTGGPEGTTRQEAHTRRQPRWVRLLLTQLHGHSCSICVAPVLRRYRTRVGEERVNTRPRARHTREGASRALRHCPGNAAHTRGHNHCRNVAARTAC